MPLLDVADLSATFSTQQGDLRAVEGVSFQMDEGTTLGIVGESGSGKSVMALSIMGLIPSARLGGRIGFEGDDLLSLPDARMRRIRGSRIAMVFQDPMSSLNPVLTVGLQLTEVIRLHTGASRPEARARAEELLRTVGIPEPRRRLKDYPHQFSGGMRQRVMIALALACDPVLILADEITTALDVTIQAQVLALLKTLTVERQTALVMITHDLGVVAGHTDRVLVMYGGQVVEQATTAELFEHPRMPYTWGLLDSMPRMDRDRSKPLVPIEGVPPDLLDPPKGCRFRDRCRFARDICASRAPDLAPAADRPGAHLVRCWGTQDRAGSGWLIGTDHTAPTEA
ncbi:ABC transporter ATP-binding protein [Oceanicola granulosus]|nr:ABC transporter ATP-binding protein [Oceanicola granulosus]